MTTPLLLSLLACLNQNFYFGAPDDDPADLPPIDTAGDADPGDTAAVDSAEDSAADSAPPDTGDSAPADSETAVEPADPVVRDCDFAGGYDRYTLLNPDAVGGVWVGGIYETRARGDAASVSFSLPGHHTLALSAYDETTWDITVGPDTTLDAVLIIGYEPQSVTGLPADVPVSINSYTQGGPPLCGYSFPYNGQGCDTTLLFHAIEVLTALPIRQFDGCYAASTLVWEPAP